MLCQLQVLAQLDALGSALTYSKFSTQFRKGPCPFNGNAFTYAVATGDVFEVGSEKPADITKFGAIDNAK